MDKIEKLQRLYDSGLSWRQVAKRDECFCSYPTLVNYVKRGLLTSRTRSEARVNRAPVKHTKDAKDKLSLIAKQKGLGGYVEGSGRGKKGRYKGFYCDSSWELAYVMYCLDHNICIERNTAKFEYVFEEQTKKLLTRLHC